MCTKATLRSAIAISFASPAGRRGYRDRVNSALVVAVIVTAPASNAALAAETSKDTTAPLEEVLVTAQKRSERQLDVPMSITAISGGQLASAGIASTIDLGQVTPGLLTTNVGTGFTPSIRGVSSSGTSAGDESNVALYIDDVYVGDTLAGMFDLPDIERVEVLKGPQGTLFGRNATGGAIRIVTRAPSFKPQASLSADYGFDFREVKLGGYVTGPITDHIAGSFSASSRTGDGFVKGSGPNIGRRYGAPDNYMFRGKLLFQMSDTFRVALTADTSRTDNQSGALPTAQGQNPFPVPGSVPNTPFHYAGGTEPIQIVRTNSGIVDATWNAADWVMVRSITAYRDFDLRYQVDIDRTSLPVAALALTAKQRNVSQEFNFFGPSAQVFTWLLGAFYYNSNSGNPYFTSFAGDAPNGKAIADFNNEVQTRSYAGFADLTWNVTSRLHATLGARYTTETKKYHYADTIRPGGLALRNVRNEATWNSPTFRGVVRYDFARDANVYVSLSDGFKSGVFNAFSPVPIPVKPEKIDALEIGAKARLSGGITLSAAAYAYNYDQLQVQAQTFVVTGTPLLTLSNAATAKIRGAEFSAEGKVMEHLAFNAGVNWEPKAEYSDYRTASVTVPIPGSAGPVIGVQVVPYNASGSRLIKAPDVTANLRLTYTTQFMGGEFAATINDAYTSGFNWQAGDLTKEPAFNVASTRLSWTDPQDRYTLSLWGTNLTNEVYSTYTSPNTRGNTQTFVPGRQIGVGGAVRF